MLKLCAMWLLSITPFEMGLYQQRMYQQWTYQQRAAQRQRSHARYEQHRSLLRAKITAEKSSSPADEDAILAKFRKDMKPLFRVAK